MPTVVLDTDIGSEVNDAIALALLTKMPGVELASVVATDAGLPRRPERVLEQLADVEAELESR